MREPCCHLGVAVRECGGSQTGWACRVHLWTPLVEAKSAPADAAPVRRCEYTGNPCGTDTWQVGAVCVCGRCQAWLREQNAAARAAAPVAEPRPCCERAARETIAAVVAKVRENCNGWGGGDDCAPGSEAACLWCEFADRLEREGVRK